MLRAALFAALALGFAASAHAQPAPCPPQGYDRAALDALKENDWTIENARRRNAFARALTACLASPDSTLRDGIAYEALYHYLRNRQLTVETMRTLAEDLDAKLIAPDPDGFGRPFAALALSEVARADRVEPYLDPGVRQRLLDDALLYFTSVRDYRGFTAGEGWRHGVAHGADLLLQLGVNPAFGKAEAERILTAIEGQVAPEEHFYIYGESERLARPLLFIGQRGLFTADEWSAYFARFPAAGEDVFASQAGLAWRHNVMAFLNVLYVNVRISEDTNDDAMLPGLEAALQALP